MSQLQGSVYVAQLVSGSDLTTATVTCTITAPDGTTSTVSSATGAVTISTVTASTSINAAQVGTYLLLWLVTGSVVGSQQDQFSVIPLEADLISLPDLKQELKIAPADTREDAWLRLKLRAAAEEIEGVTGPIRVRTVLDSFDGGGFQILLADQWVSSITSVVENWGAQSFTLTEQPLGATVNGYGYTWDRDINLLTRRDSTGYAKFFPPGMASVLVTYRAGMSVIPSGIQFACAELVRHWRNQTQSYQVGPYGGNAQDDVVMPAANYNMPNKVVELLEPWRRSPAVY